MAPSRVATGSDDAEFNHPCLFVCPTEGSDPAEEMLADAQPEEYDIGDVADAAALPVAHVTRSLNLAGMEPITALPSNGCQPPHWTAEPRWFIPLKPTPLSFKSSLNISFHFIDGWICLFRFH